MIEVFEKIIIPIATLILVFLEDNNYYVRVVVDKNLN